ncbi:putative membrane-bound spermidine synthase [Halorubrum trapanicum]|uniref:Putative membrane-bound spermidine synthase n=1 Tax=Halorubrum trapanicum TaxID=29284 RepID=A0A8J7R956_9EURY|nr:hypothetical protein [Halorubrum trapanicum]MBP1902492.1 putative membrane-bound spermidine synthase [Halorubrum trapanicum]
MDDALRRRLDAVVALLAVIAAVSVAALLLSFGRAAIVPSLVIAFVGVLVGLFVDAELY